MLAIHSTVPSSQTSDSQTLSPQTSNSQAPSSQTSSPHSKSLDTLVRIALFNQELAPGVAKQINAYRKEKLDQRQKRLLAILDDAIADKCIVVIQPIEQLLMQPMESPLTQPTSLQTEQFVLCGIS